MKKLKSRKAFTLIEVMCVVVIMVLLSGVLLVGVRLARDSYDESISRSEGELLCSTLTTAISDELRYAGSTEVDAAGTIQTFFSQKFGRLEGGFSLSDGHVMLGETALLADKAYTYGLKVTTLTVQYNAAAYAFNITLKISRNGSEITSEQFSVKPVNPVKVTGAASD